MESAQVRIASLVKSITGQYQTVDELSKIFGNSLNTHSEDVSRRTSAIYWRKNTYSHALVRLRIILEENFKTIETLALVATTRYIFELALWLKLFDVNVNYSLVYHKRHIDVQKRYYECTLHQHEREVDLLMTLEEEDKKNIMEIKKSLSSTVENQPEEPGDLISKAMREVDAKAARSFSISTDQAKVNGYAYQVHIIKTKTIPEIQNTVDELEDELRDFGRDISESVSGLKQCSDWKTMAEEANMTHEYNYIYSYTSKLLHCTPASVSSDEKCLDPEEVVIFLRYIHTKICDIVDCAKMQPECKNIVTTSEEV